MAAETKNAEAALKYITKVVSITIGNEDPTNLRLLGEDGGHIMGSNESLHRYLFNINDTQPLYLSDADAPSRENVSDPFRSMIANLFWERDTYSGLCKIDPRKEENYRNKAFHKSRAIPELYRKINKKAPHDILGQKMEEFNKLSLKHDSEETMKLMAWSFKRCESKIFSAMDELYEKAGYLNEQQ